MRKADKVFEQKPSVDALLITSEKTDFIIRVLQARSAIW